MKQKLWTSFGGFAMLAMPIIIVISCSCSNTNLQNEAKKQLQKINNVNQSIYSISQLKEKISNISQNDEVLASILGINDIELDKGWTLKYYLVNQGSGYTGGDLIIRAKVINDHDNQIFTSKQIVVRPKEEATKPTIKLPQSLNIYSIVWNDQIGEVIMPPDATFTIEDLKNSFKILNSDRQDLTIEYEFSENGAPWTGQNFGSAGTYQTKIKVNDQNDNSNEYILNVKSTPIKSEIDRIDTMEDSSKNADELEAIFESLNVGDPVTFEQVGLKPYTSDNYNYYLKVKKTWDTTTNGAILTLTIEQIPAPTGSAVKSLDTEIMLLPKWFS